MSTPPQPPSEGFGAPQDPRAGFGAPPPPSQPPQQPGQPPAAPPQDGYGYPQQPGPYGQPAEGPYGQQPGPYGQPTAPFGQPAAPYGQPPAQPGPYSQAPATQPMYGPGAPAPKPAGDGRKARLAIVVTAVVAVAAIVGGGLWYVGKDDGGTDAKGGGAKPSGSSSAQPAGGGADAPVGPAVEKAPADPASKMLMALQIPKITDLVKVDGSWLTDATYAKTDVLKIVGYDAATGKPKWTLPLPGQVCAASRTASEDGRAAFLYEPAKRVGKYGYQPCTEVAVFDVETGKLVWKGSAKGQTGGDQKIEFRKITISGQTVAAGGLRGGAAWNLADGKNLWLPKITADACYDMGYAGGPGLATVRKCGQPDARYLEVQALDPRTGAPLSTYRMSPGIEWASIVSSKPLVVAADVGEQAGDGSGISDLFSIDWRTGKLLQRIPLKSDLYAAKCEGTEVESCQKIAVGNGRVYVPTEEHEVKSGSYDKSNEIVSFDLATGKQTTDRADAGGDTTMFPLRMDGPNLIAYKKADYDTGGEIISLDGKTFKPTLLMRNPADKTLSNPENKFSDSYAEFRYSKGRLFISETMIDKPYSSTAEKDYIIVAFKTG
ncbi:PQQ-binding-like beta-propeller repeat protein [Streptomyces sp. NPDC089919]|uniref:outer membrane protein assembly factor BamB family protein n=1 Tax=Streptomyces sp. NPDC089919 TaxID=3155188 RepID=UPI00342282F7